MYYIILINVDDDDSNDVDATYDDYDHSVYMMIVMTVMVVMMIGMIMIMMRDMLMIYNTIMIYMTITHV